MQRCFRIRSFSRLVLAAAAMTVAACSQTGPGPYSSGTSAGYGTGSAPPATPPGMSGTGSMGGSMPPSGAGSGTGGGSSGTGY